MDKFRRFGRIFSVNKRGLSGVVIALIFILLGLVVSGIVWVVVVNITSSGSENVSLGQFLIDLDIKQAGIKSGALYVTVQRKPGDGNLTGIIFEITDGINSDPVRRDLMLEQYESRTFEISQMELSQISLDAAEEVSIAPVYVAESGNEIIGNKLDTMAIGVYSGDVPSGGDESAGGGDDGANGDESNEQGGSETGECDPSCSGATPICAEGICVQCIDNDQCSPGEVCVDDSCAIQEVVNSGNAYSVWPQSGTAKFFDSLSLPTDQEVLNGYLGNYYVKIPTISGDCFLIRNARYVSETGRSYVEFYVVADIDAGDQYEIWNGFQGCQGL